MMMTVPERVLAHLTPIFTSIKGHPLVASTAVLGNNHLDQREINSPPSPLLVPTL